jgi:copper transport protein
MVRRMRRLLALLLAAAACLAGASPAYGHAAFVGSEPAPGQRLDASPGRVTLVFTEPLNASLARATLRQVTSGDEIPAAVSVQDRRRLVLTPSRPLARGAYRVDWHTVSTEDGHALEGAFAFGVQVPAGAAPLLETGPLARWGWVRIGARIALYTALLMLGAALLLPLLVTRPRGWPAPDGLHDRASEVRARAVRLRGDLAWGAVGAAVVSTLADAADAARGIDPNRITDYLVGNAAGIGRVLVVVFLLATALLRDRRPRLAAAGVVLALGAVAASGHAGSAEPRVPSILNDWLHLLACSAWVGGIALLVVLWWPVVRFSRAPTRVAIAREVLAPFGRVAGGAFALVVATGAVSLVTQVGSVSAMWDTSYGRLLTLKILVVGAIAAASFAHALRLRPRLLAANPHPPERLDRRHWALWRAEPWLGLAVVAAVAGLVAFPLPPRQLDQAGQALAAVCDPCPLPRPAADELAVADSAGTNVVAAWVRRSPEAVTGTVRVSDFRGKPSRAPIRVAGAQQCGPGCRRFRLPADAATVDVAVGGASVRLPARWDARGTARARRLLARAERTMRGLTGVRELEQLSSGPGTGATTEYRLRAPDRLSWVTGRGVRSVVIGKRQWMRSPGDDWREGAYGSGLAFSTRSWFSWQRYARTVRLLRERDGTADLALFDEGTPVWFRLTVDVRTHRVTAERMIARARFGRTRFSDFGRAFRIEAPR